MLKDIDEKFEFPDMEENVAEDDQTVPLTQGSQPGDDKDFILCSKIENGSDLASLKSLDEKSDASLDYSVLGRLNKSGHSSISSFSEVHALDMEPKLGRTEHGDDVSALMADAQNDVVVSADNLVKLTKEKSSCPAAFAAEQSWVTSVRKCSEFDDIDPTEVVVEFADESDGSNSPENKDSESMNTDNSDKDACVSFHNVTYLGSAGVNAPVSEIELKRTISIMRDHATISFSIILAIGLSSDSSVRLIDPTSRTDIATYSTEKIIFWGKADDESKEKDCVAFNVSHGDETVYHCHVFKCAAEDIASKIMQTLSKVLRKNRKAKQAVLPGTRDVRLDPNNLTFKYDVTIDILEGDSKGMLTTVARDKSCFKIRENVTKRVVLCLEQVTNKTLNIERCFGLLLSPGKNVECHSMHVLDQIRMESRSRGRVHVIHGTWNPTWPDMKVLNTETPKYTRVFMSVAVDLIFSDLKEPVRIVKEAKVRVFPSNEKFWNPAKPRMHEEYTLELKENFLESGEKYYELDSIMSASEMSAKTHTKSPETSMSLRKSKKPSFLSVSSVEGDDEPVEIMGPDDEDDDEPLLSGSGQVEQECTEEVLNGWAEVLVKWKDHQTRPKQLMQLVRKGVPDPMRGQIWQMLADVDDDSEILSNYTVLAGKDSPNEQVILWDVIRTFPGHDFFKDAGGQGQESLYRICKAYSVYDEEVGYCQGLSYLIAVLLLHMPEEQAFCLLVKIMKDYGHRELFQNDFELLHQRFYILERLIEDYLPSLYRHFQSIGIEGHMFGSQWFLTLFTSKFPLSLVYPIMDIMLCEGCEISYQIALALLKDSKKEFLAQDFEGVLKQFRVSIPKKYMDEEQCKQLINVAFGVKVSKKRLGKYEKEYLQMKEEMELKEDPVERLQRENRRLMNESMRLQQENDALAHEIVITQVGMQEKITGLEEKLNKLLIEQDRTTKHLQETEDEVERLKTEEIRVKQLWRESAEHADADRNKRDRIIDDYKKICTELEERNEKFKGRLEKELLDIKSKVEECENCSKHFTGSSRSSEEGEETTTNGSLKSTLSRIQDDDKEKIILLENELIAAKLSLAEAREHADKLELKLHNATTLAAAEKPWYKKITNQTKNK